MSRSLEPRSEYGPSHSSPAIPDGDFPVTYSPLILPLPKARRTQEMLRTAHASDGGHESLVYWAGYSIGRGGVVTTVIAPRATGEYRRVETDDLENATILRWLSEMDLVLLGQAHSHPPGSIARHSLGDDLYTFSPFEGHVSVVVPDFAKLEDEYLAGWGVHRFIGGRFLFLGYGIEQEHLRIVPGELDRRDHPW